MKRAFLLGFDFGTLSCRLSAIDAISGERVLEYEDTYLHGVISEVLPDGRTRLGSGWYLQDADDYLVSLRNLVKRALKVINSEEIVSIGVDFTNCTLISLDMNGKPLSSREDFRSNPYAWTKLWKHHAAQPYAERIEKKLAESDYELYCDYGSAVSSEWLFPKVLQIYEEDPEIYDKTDLFIEGADYISYFLTGKLVRNSATLGLNAFYNHERGFPSTDFFNQIAQGWGDSVLWKLRGEILPVGSRAGCLSTSSADWLGLSQNTIVAVGHGDSEITAAGLSITEPGSMIMVIGTSTCFQILTESDTKIRGVCRIYGGMIPGLSALESGQPATGDVFKWFEKNVLPETYVAAAKAGQKTNLEYITDLAREIKPGVSGLIALDWFNGNRSVLMDYSLKGLMTGLSLSTTSQQLFRALIEAMAFGTKKIFDSHSEFGIEIIKTYAVGGIPLKNDLMMQIYADVLNREIVVPILSNISSLGCCVCASVALKNKIGTYEAFVKEGKRLINYEFLTYRPSRQSAYIYDELYKIYLRLHDFFGNTSSIYTQLSDIQKLSKEIF